jgi:glycosyltransferase involved in cell wall biosynthesis
MNAGDRHLTGRRVLVMSPFWPTVENPIFGVFVAQEVEALRRAGCEITVVSPRPRWLPVPGKRGRAWRDPAPKSLQVDGVTVHFPRFWHFPRYLGWASSGARLVRTIGGWLQTLHRERRFEVVHAHEVIPVGLGVPDLRRVLALPVVLTVHGKDPMVAQQGAAPQNLGRMTAMWHAATKVTLVGRPMGEYVRGLGCPPAKPIVIPNGTNLPSENEAPPPGYAARFGGRRVMLSVANLHETKGLDLNLRALHGLRSRGYQDIHYIAIGEGPRRAALEQLAGELGLAGRVTFLGRLSYAETMAYMAACEVFVLPSWMEAFGIVYLEAMARSRPAIGCLTQGAEDIITPDIDGLLVPPREVEPLVDALARIFADPAYARRIGANARRTAEKFSWEAHAAQVGACYETAIREDRAAQAGATAGGAPIHFQ